MNLHLEHRMIRDLLKHLLHEYEFIQNNGGRTTAQQPLIIITQEFN